MTSRRHFLWFLYLGLSWAAVPSLYRLLANAHMPVSHTILFSGLGVGFLLYIFHGLRKGAWSVSGQVLSFSLTCAILANVPFALNLASASHVPPAINAIIVSTSPLVNYLVALLTGWEDASPRRLLALALGLAAALLVILPGNLLLERPDWTWLAIVAALPLLYSLYGNYAARRWPPRGDARQVAAIESIGSGSFALPFMLALAPVGANGGPVLSAYWLIIAAIAMWVLERIAYFTLIRERGAVYTGQAAYIATPVAVIIASAIFGGAQEKWLWVSLLLLMAALYFNNTGGRPTPQAATQPSS